MLTLCCVRSFCLIFSTIVFYRYVFCEALLPEIANAIQKSRAVSWTIVDIGLDTLYKRFEYKAIGCNKLCPLCRQKCDGDVMAVDHKHRCKYHQIRGFGGVRLQDNQGSVDVCEEIEDNRRIWQESKTAWTTWGQLKLDYPDWYFEPLDRDNEPHKRRIVQYKNAWDKWGPYFCHYWGQEKCAEFIFKKCADCVTSANCVKPVHNILVLDESGSMVGDRFRWACEGAIQFIDKLEQLARGDAVTLVFFGSGSRIVCEEETPAVAKLALSRVTRSGAGTSFAAAIGEVLRVLTSINNADRFDDYEKHHIFFYTDGEDFLFPAVQMRQLFRLNEDVGGGISFDAICETASNPTLLNMCEVMYPGHGVDHLKTNVEPENLGAVLLPEIIE